MEPPVPESCRPRACAPVFRAGQGPLTGATCVGTACGPWSLSPAPEGHLPLKATWRGCCVRAVVTVCGWCFSAEGLPWVLQGNQHVRILASTISTLCVLAKDLGGFPRGSDGKERACNAGDLHSILVSGRPPGGGHDSPLQYSCWRTLMARGAWRAAVMGPQRQP